MGGKYSHLKDSLTKFTSEPEYQDRVNKKKEEIKTSITDAGDKISVTTLGMVYVRARQEKDRLEELVKAQNLIIEAMTQELVDELEGQDFSNIKLNNGVSLSIKDDIYCTVKDKPAFHAWVKAEGLDDLFTVNYQTMSSMVKGKLIDGEEIPPGVETYFKQGIMMRGGKNVDVN